MQRGHEGIFFNDILISILDRCRSGSPEGPVSNGPLMSVRGCPGLNGLRLLSGIGMVPGRVPGGWEGAIVMETIPPEAVRRSAPQVRYLCTDARRHARTHRLPRREDGLSRTAGIRPQVCRWRIPPPVDEPLVTPPSWFAFRRPGN